MTSSADVALVAVKFGWLCAKDGKTLEETIAEAKELNRKALENKEGVKK